MRQGKRKNGKGKYGGGRAVTPRQSLKGKRVIVARAKPIDFAKAKGKRQNGNRWSSEANRTQSKPRAIRSGRSIIITYRMRAEIAELSKRSQIGPDEQSVEDICAIHVASFRNWSVRLTEVARLRKDGRVAGEYAKSKGKRKKAKKESRNTEWRVAPALRGGLPGGSRRMGPAGPLHSRDVRHHSIACVRNRPEIGSESEGGKIATGICGIYFFIQHRPLWRFFARHRAFLPTGGRILYVEEPFWWRGARCWSAWFGRLDGHHNLHFRSLCPLRADRPAWPREPRVGQPGDAVEEPSSIVDQRSNHDRRT